MGGRTKVPEMTCHPLSWRRLSESRARWVTGGAELWGLGQPCGTEVSFLFHSCFTHSLSPWTPIWRHECCPFPRSAQPAAISCELKVGSYRERPPWVSHLCSAWSNRTWSPARAAGAQEWSGMKLLLLEALPQLLPQQRRHQRCWQQESAAYTTTSSPGETESSTWAGAPWDCSSVISGSLYVIAIAHTWQNMRKWCHRKSKMPFQFLSKKRWSKQLHLIFFFNKWNPTELREQVHSRRPSPKDSP